MTLRTRYGLLLLAAGLTPREAAERLRDRLGIAISPKHLSDTRYRDEGRAFLEEVRPKVIQGALATLLLPHPQASALEASAP